MGRLELRLLIAIVLFSCEIALISAPFAWAETKVTAQASGFNEQSSDATAWKQKVERFVTLYLSQRSAQAEKEILAAGRETVQYSLRKLLRSTPPVPDTFRLKVAFMMAILDIDYSSSRAILIEYCQYKITKLPTRRDPGIIATLVSAAYWRLKDPKLLDGMLELQTDGAASEAMEGFIVGMATKQPWELLKSIKSNPKRMQKVSGFLASHFSTQNELAIKYKTTLQAYPALNAIASNLHDPLRPEARQLFQQIAKQLGWMKKARQKQIQKIMAAFPVVPPEIKIPASAKVALEYKYPDWHIMGIQGFDKAVLDSLLSRDGTSALPQIIRGDFDGNGLEDIALLIRRSPMPYGQPSANVKLISLRQIKSKQWRAEELTAFPFASGFQSGYSRFTIYIALQKPGKVAFWDSKRSDKSGNLDLGTDGIELNIEGKASMLYYWNGKGYATIQSRD